MIINDIVNYSHKSPDAFQSAISVRKTFITVKSAALKTDPSNVYKRKSQPAV